MGLIMMFIEHNKDGPIYERLRSSPASFTDQELRWIMKMFEGRRPRGRNAQLPAMAFMILESRRTPVHNRKMKSSTKDIKRFSLNK